MLSEHLPHPGWQPLWYCGTRTDYIYPPALRYGTVLISRVGRVLPARAYHLYIAVFYVFGIVAVYWLVRVGSRIARRRAACSRWLRRCSRLRFCCCSRIRHDSGYWVPQRLHVLMAYGEGPHISALCVLPAALAAAFLALRSMAARRAGGSRRALCALVVANNFYGATALAIFYPVLVWSVWVGRAKPGSLVAWRRHPAARLWLVGLLAYAVIREDHAHDLKWVSQPGDLLRG